MFSAYHQHPKPRCSHPWHNFWGMRREIPICKSALHFLSLLQTQRTAAQWPRKAPILKLMSPFVGCEVGDLLYFKGCL
jgi:hypothetical protein